MLISINNNNDKYNNNDRCTAANRFLCVYWLSMKGTFLFPIDQREVKIKKYNYIVSCLLHNIKACNTLSVSILS